MPIRLNLYANGQMTLTSKGKDNFDQINWSPGEIKRDSFGLLIEMAQKGDSEAEEDADI